METPHPRLAHAAAVSTVSAVWTLVAGVAAVAVGLSVGSLALVALVAFGAVGLFDCASDIVLIVHFRRERLGTSAPHLERVAVMLVGVGLVVVGLRTTFESVGSLQVGRAGTASDAGVAMAVVSMLVLSAIAVAKRHIAAMLDHTGLRADAQLTILGALLGSVTVAGIAATRVWGWWWADPAAALMIAVGATALGAVTLREVRPLRGRRSSP